MARHVFGVIGVVALAGAVLIAQKDPPKPPPAPPAPQTQELTLTGCVVDGTDSGVYLLINAVSRAGSNETPRTFRLAHGTEELDFTLHANHQVTATGRAELKTPPEAPPGGRIDPRDLPAFEVTAIQSVAERCVSAPDKW